MAEPHGSGGGGAPQCAAAAAAEERLVVAIRPCPLAPGVAPDARLTLAPGALTVAGEGVLAFDRVFCASAGNGEVFASVAAPVVAGVLHGINGAVAAYGQTGSGKTHTMRGAAHDPGLVQRAVRVRAAGATRVRPRFACRCGQARNAPLSTLARSCPPTPHTRTRADCARIGATFQSLRLFTALTHPPCNPRRTRHAGA